MYFALFRASEKAARVLRDAQAEAERQAMDDDLPPLRLHEGDEPDGPGRPPEKQD